MKFHHPPPTHPSSSQNTNPTNYSNSINTSSCLFSKKGEYDLWAYGKETLFGPSETIQSGRRDCSQRKREKSKDHLALWALKIDHLANSIRWTDAERDWVDAIISRFGAGN
ncbi:hypothetical protein Tco_0260588 [Tanacetum coccineum]